MIWSEQSVICSEAAAELKSRPFWEYRDNFILKGGMLVAAMVGLDARSTMDFDATVKGTNVNVEDIENLIASIITVPIEDGVTFQLKSISKIMDEAEYPGIRVRRRYFCFYLKQNRYFLMRIYWIYFELNPVSHLYILSYRSIIKI